MLRYRSGLIDKVNPVLRNYKFTRSLSSVPNFTPAGKLKAVQLNKHALNAKYAVRGSIPTKAEELRAKLKSPAGKELPFKQIINANIGNPQQLDQKPLTFYRQVLSILQYPELIEKKELGKLFPKDVVERAKILVENTGSVGAYSHSQGVPYIRKSIAEFISKRDGYKAHADDIFLTTGASTAVSYLLSLLSNGKSTGFMIPIPQYPLYTATLAIQNAPVIPYYLNEQENWSVNPKELGKLCKENEKAGIDIRALVVITPGNPTGSVLKQEVIEEILEVAAEYGLVVIADEVYQENIFKGEFVSFKKTLRSLQERFPGKFDNVQLASLHSTSKGVSGECGQRGGYMEIIGFEEEVRQQILKLASISLCPVVTGQALVQLMVNPPQPGSESYELDQKERSAIHNSLKDKATELYKAFNEMEGVECQLPEGSMYCFPKISIPQKAIKIAQELGIEADEFYCHELLMSTGICAVPGSGFGQVPGTYHVRTTFLAPGNQWIYDWQKFHNKFMEKYRE
ncbi:hypothetical protein PACTADRAFT_49484 [Pachysolen tannophilus NRRL Y-2460]|uniref:Glutamate pyruvate transaminase n=1 Tax=Pachysolen tannophilus NRRL Y-2460 TaxID=669874 RepID=A0A1E4TWF3_PACTA|nr:hypothetical protein PACTADRAFT_49484 [Pachysolen tannophilus NRRL Y-2460]